MFEQSLKQENVNICAGLTVIAGAATVDDYLRDEIEDVISETYFKAPLWNAQMTKVMGMGNEPFLMQSYYGDQWPYFPSSYMQVYGKPRPHPFKGFLNE